MTVYGGPGPSPSPGRPSPSQGRRPDKLLLAALGFLVLAVIAGVVFGLQAFTSNKSGDPSAAQREEQAGAPASGPPSAAHSSAAPPPPSPTPSKTPAKPPIVAAKPSLVRAAHSGLCLQANGGNGGNATQQPCDPNNGTMLWVPMAMNGSQDTFQLVNAADNRCLSVANNSRDAGPQLWLWDCHGDTGQVFKLVKDADGYRLLNLSSNRCASVQSAQTNPGTVVIQWDCDGTAAERWQFQPLS
jgi:hypothetical protein